MIFTRVFAAALPTIFASTVLSLELPAYSALKTSQKAGVLEITMHNPKSQINLWSEETQNGLTDIVHRLQGDNQTKVVIFKSDVPKFASLLYNISALPQVTIGAVDGIARGAGNELLVSLDMRFATKRSVLGQPEVGLGAFPGGGGSQFLPGLIGRGRAMEYILSSNDIDAREAERIGWINKAFDSSTDMYAYVNKLTSRLRLFPFAALSTAKKSINLASAPPLDNVLHDASAWIQRLGDSDAAALFGGFLALTNNATLGPAELNLGKDLVQIYS
ncbi:ClpP/crotonase-like domain-containing protein [Dactylonectria estremocensis]|uniref:ClpP/crotonase-like domain-containing protein n=1 Tax=Dactylonectria estremocensis TaxID=1079267 RepID=A0A9P9IZR1_9HYPO|nr:ClpP/crotonase-like domain-containing protein [Dactylonectria estremocensis]